MTAKTKTKSLAKLRAELKRAEKAADQYTKLVDDLRRQIALHPDSEVPFTERERRPFEHFHGTTHVHKSLEPTHAPLPKREQVGGTIIERY